MGKIYNTEYRRVNPRVLRMASGYGRGDIIRAGTETVTGYLGKRDEDQSNKDIARIVDTAQYDPNGSVAKEQEQMSKHYDTLVNTTDDKSPENIKRIADNVFGVNGKLTPQIGRETDAGILRDRTATMLSDYNAKRDTPMDPALMKSTLETLDKKVTSQRADTLWDWKKGEHDSETSFNDLMSKDNSAVGGVVTDAFNSDPALQKKLEQSTYSPTELEAIKGINYTGMEDLTAELIKRDISPEAVKSIIGKTETQQSIGDAAGQATQETKYQKAERAVAEMRSKGIIPSTATMAKVDSLKAADIQARANKIKSNEAIVSKQTTQLNSLIRQAAKAKSKSKTSNSKKYKSGKISTLGKSSMDNFISEQQDKVTPWLVQNLPGTDSKTLKKRAKDMGNLGFKPDKIAWITEQVIDEGALGNNIRGQFFNTGSLADNKEFAKLAAEYDIRTAKAKKGDGSYEAVLNSQIATLQDSIAKASGKVAMYGQSTDEMQITKEQERLRGILGGPSKVANIIETGKGGTGDKGGKGGNTPTDPIVAAQRPTYSNDAISAAMTQSDNSDAADNPSFFSSLDEASAEANASADILAAAEKSKEDKILRDTEEVPFSDRNGLEMLSSLFGGSPRRPIKTPGSISLGSGDATQQEDGLGDGTLELIPAGKILGPLFKAGTSALTKLSASGLKKAIHSVKSLGDGKKLAAMIKRAEEVTTNTKKIAELRKAHMELLETMRIKRFTR